MSVQSGQPVASVFALWLILTKHMHPVLIFFSFNFGVKLLLFFSESWEELLKMSVS